MFLKRGTTVFFTFLQSLPRKTKTKETIQKRVDSNSKRQEGTKKKDRAKEKKPMEKRITQKRKSSLAMCIILSLPRLRKANTESSVIVKAASS